MYRTVKIFSIVLFVMVMSFTVAYAQNSISVIWDAPSQWTGKVTNVNALEAKLKEVLPASDYVIQPLVTMNEKLAYYRSSNNMLAKNQTEVGPKLSKEAILNLAAGSDYAMVIRMNSIISDVNSIGQVVVPTVVNYYVFDIADVQVYNAKTGKLLYKNKQFLGKGDDSTIGAMFKSADSVSQERKDEIFQTAFDKCLENFTFDASHIHLLEK